MEDNFLDLAQLDAIPDEHLLDDNQEYSLNILKARIGESKGEKTAGQPYLMVTLKAEGEPDSRPFNEVFMLPTRGLDQDVFNRRGRDLREFLKAIEFDYSSGWNILEEPEAIEGLSFNAVVRVTDDETFGEQNSVKTIVS